MDLTLKTKAASESPAWLDTTEALRFVVAGVTIDADTVAADGNGKKIIKSGTPLGKITATGLYGPASDAAVDGRETAVALLWNTLEVTDGDKIGAALDHARVREAALPVVVTAAQKAELMDRGITFR